MALNFLPEPPPPPGLPDAILNDTMYKQLLATIKANPGDDAARLVLADWLEEYNEADRADFIRAQITLAKSPPEVTEAELRHAEIRVEDFLKQRSIEFPESPLPAQNHYFPSRGFADSLHVNAGWLLDAENRQYLAEMPHPLHALQLANLRARSIDADALDCIFHFIREQPIEKLSLQGNAIGHLLTCENEQYRERVEQEMGIRNPGLVVDIIADGLRDNPRLTSLDLSNMYLCPPPEAGLVFFNTIADAVGSIPTLSELNLAGNLILSHPRNNDMAKGMQKMLSRLPHLRKLDVSLNYALAHFEGETIDNTAFCKALTAAKSLTTLNFADNRPFFMNLANLESLCDTLPQLPALTSLNLENGCIGYRPDSATAITAFTLLSKALRKCPQLVDINLRNNGIGNIHQQYTPEAQEKMRLMMGALHDLPHLTSLNLEGNHLFQDNESLTTFTDALKDMPRLQRLDLSSNAHPHTGERTDFTAMQKVLAALPPNLVTLVFDENYMNLTELHEQVNIVASCPNTSLQHLLLDSLNSRYREKDTLPQFINKLAEAYQHTIETGAPSMIGLQSLNRDRLPEKLAELRNQAAEAYARFHPPVVVVDGASADIKPTAKDTQVTK